jgi:hypothetical protein
MATLVNANTSINYQPVDVDPEEAFTDNEDDPDQMFDDVINDPEYVKYLGRINMWGVKILYEEDETIKSLPWYKRFFLDNETVRKGKVFVFASQRSIIEMTNSPYFQKKLIPMILSVYRVTKIAFMPTD